MALAIRRAAPAEAPAESGARAALAEAIEARAEADKARERVQAAHARLEAKVYEGHRAMAAAEIALEQAKDAPGFLVKQALGELAELPKSVPEARAELEAAEASLAAAREARDTIQAQLDRDPDPHGFGERRLKMAAGAVLREAPSLGAVLDDLERLQRDIVERGVALVYLVREGVLNVEAGPGAELSPIEARARAIWHRLQSPPTSWRGIHPEVGDAPWRRRSRRFSATRRRRCRPDGHRSSRVSGAGPGIPQPDRGGGP